MNQCEDLIKEEEGERWANFIAQRHQRINSQWSLKGVMNIRVIMLHISIYLQRYVCVGKENKN